MYRAVTDMAEVRKYLGGASIVAFDFETAPDEEYRDEEWAALDAHKAHIVGVSFSTDKDDGIYVPMAHKIGANADAAEILRVMADFAVCPNTVKVAHNLAFESMFLYAQGIVIQPPCYDTIAAAQLTIKGVSDFRQLRDCGLKTLAPQMLDMTLPSFEEVTGGRSYDELDPADPETIRYACADSDSTLRLYHKLNEWFERYLPKHRFIAEQIESPTAVYCGLMKYNGLQVDAALMEDKSQETEKKLASLRKDIAFIIGDVNIGANASTAAFKKYLFDDLKLPVLKTTAKSQYASDDETLVLLREWCEKKRPDLVPLFKLVQQYRRWGKIKSTYIEGYAQYVNSATGRIHADLMPLATETGRFAARKPNLQNMPRAGADDIGVRNFFMAPEGYVLLSLDFSQIELRVGAFYCRDEKMLETYRVGGDIHDQTATVIYGPGKHNKEQRTIAKNVNFGTFFGLFPRGLQRTLKFKAGVEKSLEECEKIIENLKEGYPALIKWQEETKAAVHKRKYSDTWLGRKRSLRQIRSDDWGKKSYAERCALNTPIQGTAADILKLALGRIIAGLPERRWLWPLLQIHDELVFELPAERVPEAVSFIRGCMEAQPFPEFDVPIIAEAACGRRFGEMTEIQQEI